MKITFLLLVTTTILFVLHTTSASPIQVIQAYSDSNTANAENKIAAIPTSVEGRQQTVNTPAVISAPLPAAAAAAGNIIKYYFQTMNYISNVNVFITEYT